MRDMHTGEICERLEKNLQEVMEEYPFASKVAARKWVYLKAHGYTSDRRTEKGLLIYKREHPHLWGEIDWWGKVTWGGG